MALATLADLEAELISVLQGLPIFTESGFSVFNLADFDAKRSAQTLPSVGVAYDGAEPIGKDGVPVTAISAASMLAVQFVIVIAIQYSYTAQDDTKQQAFALLDQTRAALLGMKGVNTRPWRFIGERPEDDASGDGVVFYSQVWQTTLPILGNFNNL